MESLCIALKILSCEYSHTGVDSRLLVKMQQYTREKESQELHGWRGRVDLGGDEGQKIMIRVYCMV